VAAVPRRQRERPVPRGKGELIPRLTDQRRFIPAQEEIHWSNFGAAISTTGIPALAEMTAVRHDI